MGMESGNCCSGMTPSEAILVSDRNRNYDDGMFGGNGSWVFFLFFLLAWGNGGWGGFGNNAAQGALTRSDLCEGFNFQNLENGIRGIQNGLCDGFYAQNTTMLQGFNGIERELCSGFGAVNQNINQARFDSQQCCCETNRNIDAVRYENARNTCDIVNAIKEDGAATRALMTQNTIQELRDNLQAAQLQLGQLSQTSTLISTLRPFPTPAYITCSPYTTTAPYGAYNGCGYTGYNGCGGCCN